MAISAELLLMEHCLEMDKWYTLLICYSIICSEVGCAFLDARL